MAKNAGASSNQVRLSLIPCACFDAQHMQQAEASRRKAKRRQAAIFSDDDDENGSAAGGSEAARSMKRARTEEGSVGGTSVGDLEMGAVGEGEVKIEDEEPNEEDTRFLPPSRPVRRGSSAASGGKGRGRSASTKKGASKKKRAVVMSDDDAEDDYEEPLDAGAMYDSEDEDFEPEHSHSKKKTKPRATRRASRGPDGDITVKDERGSVPLPAAATEDEETVDIESVAKEPTPPPKKRKFPPIKKIKAPATAGSTAASTPTSKLPGKSTEGAFALPGAARKPAATIANADFDLRDANVYASLFNKASRCLVI